MGGEGDQQVDGARDDGREAQFRALFVAQPHAIPAWLPDMYSTSAGFGILHSLPTLTATSFPLAHMSRMHFGVT